MIRTYELHHMIDMTENQFRASVVFAQKDANTIHAYYSPGGSAGLDQLIRDVSIVGLYRACVGVRKNHRIVGVGHHIAPCPVSGMRATDHHSDALHLGQHCPPMG